MKQTTCFFSVTVIITVLCLSHQLDLIAGIL